jgi:predicted RNase H-like HicB family nuclease
MKHYYALFKKTDEAVEVEFPDLQGCFTFGKDWEEALENAEDVLAAWLANADPEFIKEPSKHHELEHLSSGELVPVLVDENIIASYRKLKRFNVIFPAEVLKQIDKFRKKKGLKRSTFLQKAAEEYLQQHDANG